MGINFSCCKNNNKNLTWSNTKSFIPPIKSGIVIKVYDGDTITVATKLPFKKDNTIYRFSIRLKNIDCPEINSNNPEEKEYAFLAKNALSQKILNKEVIVKNTSIEKYGRILADVYLKNELINDWLLENRYGVKYDGKSKNLPKSWKNYKENNII